MAAMYTNTKMTRSLLATRFCLSIVSCWNSSMDLSFFSISSRTSFVDSLVCSKGHNNMVYEK